MPVSKCSNGKWRVGSGPCQYSSKAKAESAWQGAKAAGVKSTVNDQLIHDMQSLGRKYSQSEAGFRGEIGVRGLQCGECANFMPGGGTCAIVKGKIEAGDVCNFYDPSIHIGDMDALFAKSKTIDMFISKASQDPETGEMRWAAVASDTDLDFYEDRMSIELFEDFIERIEANEGAPSVFTSEAWKGGMPYLGISHYLDLDGAGIVGDPSSIYVDGNRLKSKGTFRATNLGEAAFAAVKADQKNGVPNDERIRISIAFVDWAHTHGDKLFTRESLSDECRMCAADLSDKIYKRGQLVHLALTRVPVNERTPIWLEERAMTTMKEDALSVLGEEHEEEVEKLDELSRKDQRKVYRSEAVIVKSEEDEAPSTEEEEEPKAELVKRFFGGATSFDEAEAFLKQSEELDEIFDSFSMLDGILWNIYTDVEVKDKPAAMSQAVTDFKSRVDSAVKRSLTIRAAQMILEAENEEGETMADEQVVVKKEPGVEKHILASPLDDSLSKLKAVVIEAAAGDGPMEDRLKTIQPVLNSLAETVKATVEGEDIVNAKAVATAVASAVSEQLTPLTEAIQLLAAKAESAPKLDATMIPGPRAHAPSIIGLDQKEKSKSPITLMIRKSVGLKN